MRVRSVNKSRRLQGGGGKWSPLKVAGAGVAGVAGVGITIKLKKLITSKKQKLFKLKAQRNVSTDETQKERLSSQIKTIEEWLQRHRNLVQTISSISGTDPTDVNAELLNYFEGVDNAELI